MRQFHENLVLRRAPEVYVTTVSGGEFAIYVGNNVVRSGPHTLAILDIFGQSTKVAHGLNKLRERVTGAQDWIDVMNSVLALYESGALIDDRTPPTRSRVTTGFDKPELHISMLNDRTRTSAFLEAIQQYVRPHHIVVDLGSGTGVLAVAAALAGAKHVYAIEKGGIAEGAQQVINANGLGNRVTIIKGLSTTVTIPERADVLIGEIIGNEPLRERVLEIFLDARIRLLKKNPIIIPNLLKIFVLPLCLPDGKLDQMVFSERNARRWRQWYGINFDPLITCGLNTLHPLSVEPQEAKGWKTLSPPIQLAEIKLSDFTDTRIDESAEFVATGAGTVTGLLISFELELASGLRLSTIPTDTALDNHWKNIIHFLQIPLEVKRGEAYRVRYTYKHYSGYLRGSVDVSPVSS